MSLFPRFRRFVFMMLLSLAATPLYLHAADKNAKPAADAPAPDTLVLSNGDTLHGKLVEEAGGTVTFHCDPLGDVKLTWDKIKELHAGENFAVLNAQTKNRGRKAAEKLPAGSIDVANGALTSRASLRVGTGRQRREQRW